MTIIYETSIYTTHQLILIKALAISKRSLTASFFVDAAVQFSKNNLIIRKIIVKSGFISMFMRNPASNIIFETI